MAVKQWVLWLGCVAALTACGGSAGKAGSPERPADTVDSLADSIEAEERSLRAELGPPPAAAPAAGKPALDTGLTAEETKAAESVSNQPEPSPTSEAPPRAVAPCETACKALASMRRSQERICEIAGTAHERCEWAKRKVGDAVARVEAAGCVCA